MTRAKLTLKGAVRLALCLQNVLETRDCDRASSCEKYEEAVRLIDGLLRGVDGLVVPWDEAAELASLDNPALTPPV